MSLMKHGKIIHAHYSVPYRQTVGTLTVDRGNGPITIEIGLLTSPTRVRDNDGWVVV